MGLSRVYRASIWNWIDLVAYGGLWAIIVALARFRAFGPMVGRRRSDDGDDVHGELSDRDSGHRDLVVFTTMPLWAKLLGYVKGASLECASFVLMLVQISVQPQYRFIIPLAFEIGWKRPSYARAGGGRHYRGRYVGARGPKSQTKLTRLAIDTKFN